MKIKQSFKSSISIAGILLFFGCTQTPKTPLEELKNIGEQMKQHEQIDYEYQINMYRSYAGDTSQIKGTIYFETNQADTNIGFNFSVESEDYTCFYNGAYMIHMTQKDSFAWKKPFCDYKDGHMTSYPFLELSYVAIQNFLSDSLFTVRTDSIVKVDTVIDSQHCYSYTFWTDSRIVDTYKLPIHEGRKKIRLSVRNHDHLPVRYSQYIPMQDKKYYFHEVQFSNYSFEKRYPFHQFSIENVPEYYSWDKYKIFQTLELETNAPDWELPLVSGNKLSLTDLRGKYILLDFWFIGCGACIESVPSLNALQTRFKNSNFEVIGINCYSNDEQKIEGFCNDRDMQFRNVWKGESICDDYLINAAPIFYLINKDGKIVYTQIGHDDKRLIDNVEKILNDGS